MKKVKLENVDIGLEEKLKDKEFKRLYEWIFKHLVKQNEYAAYLERVSGAILI